MSRPVMIMLFMMFLAQEAAVAKPAMMPDDAPCLGLPISQFESRFPNKVKRLTLRDDMLEVFVDFWKAGSRPEFPKRPERVVIYALPSFPLIIGYQESHCIIAYLAIDSTVLGRWLEHRLGWKV